MLQRDSAIFSVSLSVVLYIGGYLVQFYSEVIMTLKSISEKYPIFK